MGLLSSPRGTGSEPTKSESLTPGGSKLCSAISTDGFFENVLLRVDRLGKDDPGVRVERPVVAVPALSSVLDLPASRKVSLGVDFGVTNWYRAWGRVGL